MTIFKRISNFLLTRIYWILLLLGLQVVILVVGYLDRDLSMESAFYLVLVNLMIIILFLFFAYMRETAFLKKLSEMHEVEELKHKEAANSPMEREVLDYLYTQIVRQKKIVSDQAIVLKEQEQSLTHFVHEMKTPLTAMKLLIEKEKDKENKNALLFEWSRLNEMLDNQLYLVRLDSKNRDTYFESVNLKRMIIEEIQITRHVSQLKGIGFEMDFEADYQVFTDMKWCKMLLRQLISNAIKYSPEGQDITIHAFTHHDYVNLTISDKGRGIPPKDLPRIYERGFTSTGYRNETTSSGIGLYLVDQIKNTLGLNVKIDSAVNHGTKVTIIFPKQNEITAREAEVTTLSL
ncbi:histidine kinase [Staphylococcus carnosus]|uniref:sensor histidine kinase n=1 Tax=Staphylococcus carnosus TaxID=1281 RepID=UPI0006ABE56D|nr:sensor histidine kinase [Staphylococcus carnosus]ANZ34059.1 histidine kinase [Staphylococcus carnosus]KOR14250.1 histidine kinase [Staphylococcus carnosus]UTB81423.1 histidine kinase [Staphylococcus carnosus]UTB86243.1 histidine kinase [Staphylococcus carnosus]